MCVLKGKGVLEAKAPSKPPDAPSMVGMSLLSEGEKLAARAPAQEARAAGQPTGWVEPPPESAPPPFSPDNPLPAAPAPAPASPAAAASASAEPKPAQAGVQATPWQPPTPEPPSASGDAKTQPDFLPTEIEPIQAPGKSGVLLWLVAAAVIGGGVYAYIRMRPAPPPAQPQAPAKLVAQEPKVDEGEVTKPSEPVKPKTPAPADAPIAPWDFEGQIYDMLTLKPVPGVEMTFYSEEGNHQTKSGNDGRFKLRVPGLKTGVYRLITDHPDYVEDYFDDIEGSYRKQSLKKRAGMRATTPKNLPWNSALKRDIVLFPLVPDK